MRIVQRLRNHPELLPIAIYTLLALLVVPIYPHFLSPNEFSRWVVDVSIVDDHSLEVSHALHLLGGRFEDLALIDGRFYSNKAPGAALVALPAYAATRVVAGAPSAANVRLTLTGMRLAAATLPTILLALLLAAVARRLGCSERRIAIAVVTLLFATPLFAYGLLLFSHALTAFALFAAWALLFEVVGARGETLRNEIAAGAMIGLAVLSEYPMAIAAVVLVACALPAIRLRGAMRVALGGLPFAILLGAYNAAAFGSAFALGSGHEAEPQYRALAQHGLFGVGLPSPAIVARILFDPSKGMFVLSPILLLAFAGAMALLRRSRSAGTADHAGAPVQTLTRYAFAALLATPAAVILTYSGYPNWHGGWTVGARYVVAALPFLLLLTAFATESWLQPLLLGASVLAIALTTLVFPFVPPEFPLPWSSFALPLLRHGLVAPNLLHFVARSLAIAVPFALVAVALLTVTRGRNLLLAIAGAVTMLAIGIAVSAENPRPLPARVLLAFIEQVHFGVNGSIARALPPGASAPRVEKRAEGQKALLPLEWPF